MMRKRKGYKVYPLTVAQKFHLYYLPFCPTAAVLNIGTSLTIEEDLDWDLLAKSINQAYARSEGMRIRFAKDKEGNWYQYVVNPEEKEIEFADFTDKTVEEAHAVMQQWTTVPFKMEDSPMTRVVMIKMPDGFNGIYFLGHHMVVDAQSLICFLKDIIELYCNEKYEGVPYPKDMASYIEQLEKDLAYEAGSKAQARDIEYFQKEIAKSEPIFSGIRGKGQLEAAREMFKNPDLRSAFSATDDTKSALDIFHLEAEPTRRLMDFCETYHVSLACLLLMGLRTYLQKMNGIYFIPIFSVVLVGMLSRYVPAIAAKSALIAGCVIIAIGYFVPPFSRWVDAMNAFHFVGAVFVALCLYMVAWGKLAPRPTPFIQEDVKAVDMTSWKYAPLTGGILILVVVVIYISFAK